MPTDPDRAAPGEDGAKAPMDAAMAAFRDRARDTNLARVEVIEEALGQLQRGVLREEARLTARRAAHSLVGSAGTFGMREASELGRTLEAILDDATGAVGPQVRAGRGLEVVTRLRVALGGSGGSGGSGGPDRQGGGSDSW